MQGKVAIATSSLNKAMQLNLSCLLLHLMLYTSLPALLMARHNPFSDLIVAFAIAGFIGLWLCLDFMLPVYMEARLNRSRDVARPAGWLLSLNLIALGGAAGSALFIP